MHCNRPYEIFAMSSPNYATKKKYSVTLDFDVYEDFNPYEIDWKKIFQIEGQEQLDVDIKNLFFNPLVVDIMTSSAAN